MSAWAMKRISDFKFIVKNISKSPSTSVTNKQPLPQMISSPSAKNPLGLDNEKKKEGSTTVLKGAPAIISSGDCAKKNRRHRVLEKKKEGCCLRPQVKYSTWDEILRKTKRIDDNDMMMMKNKGSSPSSAVKTSSSSPVFNLKGVMNSSDNTAKNILKTHQGADDPSAMKFSTATAKANKTVSMDFSTAKPKKTVNAVPRKSATGNHKAAVPVLVRRKSNHHDSDSRHMQFKANKDLIFPHKRPRDQDDNETSALNLKRRKTTLTSSRVKPKPAESPQTSAKSCQTVVSKKAVVDSLNDSSDASSVINVPADEQPKAVFKNAAHSSTIKETSDIDSSAQEEYCGIFPIIDEDTYNRAKHKVELLTNHEDTILRYIPDPLEKEARKQKIRRKVIIIKGKMRAYEKRISLEKVVENNEKRIAARIALEKEVKTVEFNDTNTECMKELDRLINVRQFDLNFAPSAVPKPLEWIGLFVHPDLE